MRRHRVRARSRVGLSVFAIAVRCLGLLVFFGLTVFGLRWLAEGDRAPTADREPKPTSISNLAVLGALQPDEIHVRNRRLVYPYSVVPGGVRSPNELHEAAAHDAVVAEHYSGFDYKYARVVDVDQPKLVYLSYRRGNHIYWTRKQATLRVGEKLITDGHITARTRCGNQVSTLPQANTSPVEPTIAELDRPDAIASGAEQLFPTSPQTDLLQIDPLLPGGSLGPGNAFAGGPPPGGFMPPPIGGGGGVSTPISSGCPPNSKNNSKTCNNNPPPPPPPPPPPVPEPGTIVLVASGAATVLTRYRLKK